ncbi:hypothetical protein BpHYR1_044321 [Brachionus plicatilis]|uniref:Uncharacterized protein n=1 Tax=Brachionus plicatilis TaxID=10195 RepID=A0A3M7T6C8_BRAPC|nr:hypothetical protein BpHYR1_044321 [Brachionus plicatilis]
MQYNYLTCYFLIFMKFIDNLSTIKYTKLFFKYFFDKSSFLKYRKKREKKSGIIANRKSITNTNLNSCIHIFFLSGEENYEPLICDKKKV